MERWKKFRIKSREIWDVELSYPGEGVGHEERFKHPCIIVEFNKFVDMATIIPLTSNIQALKEFPYTHIIKPNDKNGLTKQSIAMVYQIRSLSKQRFIYKRGNVIKINCDVIKTLLKEYFQI